MAICLGGADINSVLTLLMNPPPATNFYANCHGNSGINRIFLHFILLWSTAATILAEKYFVEASATQMLQCLSCKPLSLPCSSKQASVCQNSVVNARSTKETQQ